MARSVPANKVCICAGTEKIPAIIAASRNGLFDTLITDYKTVNEMNERLSKEDRT